MRLVDADELKKNFQDELCKGIACAECSMQVEGFCRAERWIDIAPTIEAEPTKHGTWEETAIVVDEPIMEYKCSICGGYTYWYNYLVVPDYCPNCGARMKEVEE